MNFKKSIGLSLALLFSSEAFSSENYCHSPPWSPVYGKSYHQLSEIAAHHGIKAVECSLTETLLGIDDGYFEIENFKNHWIVANQADEQFQVIAQVDGYSIFAYRFNNAQILTFALKSTDWELGEAFQTGIYRFENSRNFRLANGFKRPLIILSQVRVLLA